MFFEPGDLVDRFRIIKRIDSGGMGDVYLALDTQRFVNVALKILQPDSPNYERLLRRFTLEAELYRRIAHPNIVGMMAAGRVGNVDYIALEHLRGQSLAQLLHEKGLVPLELAVSVMQDLAYALQAAHQADVIHRDIKPQNIMITQDGVAKLIDFGVAKESSVRVPRGTDRSVHREDLTDLGAESAITSGSASTGSGSVVGTLAYSSPEQLQCQMIDGRTDIYSLGLVLYELFTGQRPVSGASASDILLCQSKLDGRVPPPSQVRAGIEPAIDAIILKMIRYEPDERFQSSLEVLEAIHAMDLTDRSGGGAPDAPARSKALANLELTDTYYWKATSLIEKGLCVQAVQEFSNLLTATPSLGEQFRVNVLRQLDLLFWSRRPELVALDGDLPPRTGTAIGWLEYVSLLAELVPLYYRLDRPRSAALAVLVLDRQLARARADGRADALARVQPRLEALRATEVYRASRDALESLREGDGLADGALARVMGRQGGSADEASSGQADLLLDGCVQLAALGKDARALEGLVQLLRRRDHDPEAIALAAFLLAERGLRLPDDGDEAGLLVELYRLLGLFESAATELQRGLRGDVDDLAVLGDVAAMYQRAGLDRPRALVLVEVAERLIAADRIEEGREQLLAALALAPRDPEVSTRVKGMPDVTRAIPQPELKRLCP